MPFLNSFTQAPVLPLRNKIEAISNKRNENSLMSWQALGLRKDSKTDFYHTLILSTT